jgi:SAM-dependent methyltransferase
VRAGRARYDEALQPARLSAYPTGEFVGQESFMRAGEILSLAVEAGVAPGVSVLDLCCGVAGPGRFITSQLGCAYTGVDASPDAIDIARERAVGLPCRFEVGAVPPVPAGPFDVVLLLETILAFPDKESLLHEIAAALSMGGRFAFTLEEGRPLTEAERRCMPHADTVWLTPLPELLACLERVGLRLCFLDECSDSHRVVVDSLLDAFSAEATHIAEMLGPGALDDLLVSHRLWSDWLSAGRVRKFALVAEKD